ncbi:MAG: COX15/CtaA family protein [Granulosicoccaceae bacterium]
MKTQFKALNTLAAVATAMALVVVILGAYVRLSDAGLGCPDWPGCYGHIGVPALPDDIQQANSAYPERPVEVAKAWKEMIHRYIASLLGLMVLVMAVLAWRRRGEGAPVKHAFALLALVIFQGMLGMWTVTLLVKPAVVTAHLFGGLATLALLWLMWLRTRRVQPEAGGTTGLRLAVWAGLLVLLVQIFLGGWTSTNYAALACPDLPKCHGQWLPETDFADAFKLWRGLGVDYEGGVLSAQSRITVHFSHRVWALVTVFALLWLSARVLCTKVPRSAQFWAKVLVAVISAQFALGVSNVYFTLPLAVATAHNGGAALCLLTVVALLYSLRRDKRLRP